MLFKWKKRERKRNCRKTRTKWIYLHRFIYQWWCITFFVWFLVIRSIVPLTFMYCKHIIPIHIFFSLRFFSLFSLLILYHTILLYLLNGLQEKSVKQLFIFIFLCTRNAIGSFIFWEYFCFAAISGRRIMWVVMSCSHFKVSSSKQTSYAIAMAIAVTKTFYDHQQTISIIIVTFIFLLRWLWFLLLPAMQFHCCCCIFFSFTLWSSPPSLPLYLTLDYTSPFTKNFHCYRTNSFRSINLSNLSHPLLLILFLSVSLASLQLYWLIFFARFS